MLSDVIIMVLFTYWYSFKINEAALIILQAGGINITTLLNINIDARAILLIIR